MSTPAPDSNSPSRGSVSFEATPIIASCAAMNLSWYLEASAIRAATLETGPRIGQSFCTRRTLPSSWTT